MNPDFLWQMSRDRPIERCPECGNVLKMEYVGPPDDPHDEHGHGARKFLPTCTMTAKPDSVLGILTAAQNFRRGWSAQLRGAKDVCGLCQTGVPINGYVLFAGVVEREGLYIGSRVREWRLCSDTSVYYQSQHPVLRTLCRTPLRCLNRGLVTPDP